MLYKIGMKIMKMLVHSEADYHKYDEEWVNRMSHFSCKIRARQIIKTTSKFIIIKENRLYWVTHSCIHTPTWYIWYEVHTHMSHVKKSRKEQKKRIEFLRHVLVPYLIIIINLQWNWIISRWLYAFRSSSSFFFKFFKKW